MAKAKNKARRNLKQTGEIDPTNDKWDATFHTRWDAIINKHPEVATALAGLLNGLPTHVGLAALANVASNIIAQGEDTQSEDTLCRMARCFGRYIHTSAHNRYDDYQKHLAQNGKPTGRPN